MDRSEQAPHACATCKTRKKGCDKKIPTCGYCAQRSLLCEYASPAASPNAVSNISTKRVPVAAMPAAPPNPEILRNIGPSIRSSLLMMDTLSDTLPSHYLPYDSILQQNNIHGMVYSQVCRIIQATGQYIDDVTVCFFQGVHLWIPIVSRRRFLNRLMNFRGQQNADFAILLLSMCLLTYKPYLSPGPKAVDPEALYLTVKMLLAHVQALIPHSIDLIKANMLISMYEYGQGKPDAAFMSIGLCARMAYAAGLHEAKLVLPTPGYELDQEADEARNVWWGIVICERAYYCDIPSPNQPLITTFPDVNDFLPSKTDFSPTNQEVFSAPNTPTPVSAFGSPNIGSFGRSAQAAYFLSEVLDAIKIHDSKFRRSTLTEIDVDLQRFLFTVLDQWRAGDGDRVVYFCGSIALGIRALFILHWHILSHPVATREDEVWRESSLAAMDTVTKMVLEIARMHVTPAMAVTADTRPPFFAYDIREALRHLRVNRREASAQWQVEFEDLRRSLETYDPRWNTNAWTAAVFG